MSNQHPKQSGVTRRQMLGWLGAAPAAAMLPWDPVSAQASSGTLRVRFGSDVGNLDPAKIFAIENQTVAGHVYNGLVKYDQKTNKIVPDLASSWEITPDGTVFTFKLRDGVKFHKGYGQLTSDDVKFSLDRILDPATASPYRGQLSAIKSVSRPAVGDQVRRSRRPPDGSHYHQRPRRRPAAQAVRLQPGLDCLAQGSH
ncbi:MAG: hypothetical protein IT507_07290 [Burkholderiaceae bacterium]|nr:hypothetical protein [Burkholderiaceae bacterium]